MTTTILPPGADPAAAHPARQPAPDGRRPWERPALAGLLGATALLYLWGLGASGWANAFYSAAVQAGTRSWSALLFGASDAAGSITVDKPPASLWVMELSARIFGVNSWSILVPQAIEGVAAVALLYAAVRRWHSPAAGLLAGAVMATTPVAVLMFRFNNPDALLVLLLTGAAYATVRAIEAASTRWLVLAATLVGFGFLTKMLQAFLLVPVLALAYLVAAPTPVRRRLLQLVAAGLALFASSAWWVALVELWPAGSRPYIGGSQHNSVLELIFGYNGLGRLTGNEVGSVTPGGVQGGGQGGGIWGATGALRLFTAEVGGQAAWLIPAALILAAASLWVSRDSRLRASILLWGGWLLVTWAVFSYMQGIYHPYYNVALAPAIGALVGIGAVELWRWRSAAAARIALSAAVAVTAVWSAVLLHRSPTWHPQLRWTVLIGGLGVAGALLAPALGRRAAAVAAATAIAVGLAGPLAYSLETAATPHSGSLPTAGPAVAGTRGPGGMRGPGGFAGPGGFGGLPQGGIGAGAQPGAQTGPRAGGLLDASAPGAALTQMLVDGAQGYTWAAAAVGAQTAAGYQLASGEPVMAVGGFNGSDPSPTLAQFRGYVAAGKIHYFIAGGMDGGFGPGGANGGSRVSSQIAAWVAESYTATTVDGVTVYDLGGGAATA